MSRSPVVVIVQILLALLSAFLGRHFGFALDLVYAICKIQAAPRFECCSKLAVDCTNLRIYIKIDATT